MTHIEQAIVEARKNGWEGVDLPSPEYFQWSEKRYGQNYDQAAQALMFLDPLFWKAYGKARGWEEHKGADCECIHVGQWCYMSYWELLIHHVAEGKDAESFFANLSN